VVASANAKRRFVTESTTGAPTNLTGQSNTKGEEVTRRSNILRVLLHASTTPTATAQEKTPKEECDRT